MFVSVLPFITSYLDDVDRALKAHAKGRGLTGGQRQWLSFCLMGVLLSNTVSWASFERCGLCGYRLSALSWMFRRTKRVWEVMFQASVGVWCWHVKRQEKSTGFQLNRVHGVVLWG